MDFENIKADILEIYPKWKALGSTYDDEKTRKFMKVVFET